jgi:hypothetical protein
MKKLFLSLLTLSLLCFGQTSQFTNEAPSEINLDNKESVQYEFTMKPKVEIAYYVGQQYFTRLQGADTTNFRYGQFLTRTGLDFNFGPFTLYFDTNIYMNKSTNSASFAPNLAEFYSGLKIDITNKIALKVEHLCIHSLRSWGNDAPNLYGGYNKISLSYGY